MTNPIHTLREAIESKLEIHRQTKALSQKKNELMNFNLFRRAEKQSVAQSVNLPLLNFIASKPWAISKGGLQKLASHARSEISLEFADFFELRPETVIMPDGNALIHVHAALVDSCPAIYEKLGLVTRYSTIADDIAAVAAKGAKSITLVINSPGGTVSGLKEAANAVTASRLPVSSYCSGLACSAAYFLAAGTKRITASPSGTVGNIGTIMSWADDTAFWESIGINFKALTNEGADLKSTFHLEPDEAQLAFLQESINEAGKDFRAHVEAHRKGINPEVFRAGWYSGEKAKSLGLVDAIGTLDGSKASPTPAATNPSASSLPKPTSMKTDPKATAPIAAKPIIAPAAAFPKKPDFSSLKGVDRACASMRYEADRKKHFLAEAERLVAAEEAASQPPDPTAGQPITAASIAKALVKEQAEAAKTEPSSWSAEATARRRKVADLAAQLMRSNS